MQISKSFKKALTGILACVLALGITAGITACSSGPSDEELITAQLDELFTLFKNPTEENLKPYMGDVDSSDLKQVEDMGIDIYEFMGHSFGHLDYTIDSIDVDGDTAVATVTITSADVPTALNAASDYLLDDANTDEVAEVYKNEGEQGLYKFLFNKYYEIVDAQTDDELVTTTATLTAHKDSDGNWTATEEDFADVISAVYGGMSL